MNAKPIKGLMNWLGIALAGYIGGWVLLMLYGSDGVGRGVALLTVALLIGSVVTYLVCLGMVATRTGRSWITWVGLTIIFSPFSYLIAAPLMQSKINKDAKKAALAT